MLIELNHLFRTKTAINPNSVAAIRLETWKHHGDTTLTKASIRILVSETWIETKTLDIDEAETKYKELLCLLDQ